jgi:hypothetical protein
MDAQRQFSAWKPSTGLYQILVSCSCVGGPACLGLHGWPRLHGSCPTCQRLYVTLRAHITNPRPYPCLACCSNCSVPWAHGARVCVSRMQAVRSVGVTASASNAPVPFAIKIISRSDWLLHVQCTEAQDRWCMTSQQSSAVVLLCVRLPPRTGLR